MIFHDSNPKNFFSKHKNKAESKFLDDSEVLSSDFPGLNSSAASMTSVASTASMTSIASFHQKTTDPDGLIIPGTKLTNTSPFLCYGSFATFLLEAVEARQCYFFKKWFLCLKISNLRIPNPPSNKI